VSTTMDLRPRESELEPLADPFTEPVPTITLPGRAGPLRRKRRFRLSRRARLARTLAFVLVIVVTLSSIGVLPGNVWPLSLFTGGGAGASTRTLGLGGPTDSQILHGSTSVGPEAAPPSLWPFAQAKGLTLYVPTHRLLGIGYHEASLAGGLSLTPLGRCVDNANTARFRIPAPTAGPDYVILQSRHRRQGPTTAADVAMSRGSMAVAPISGTVVRVTLYRLYKYWLDYRVEISPGGTRRLRVVMIHLTDIRVSRGAVVVAGMTPIGRPRLFPFHSDINDYVGAGVPHVHLEVKELGPPRRKA
jgi:hypothetical protein